MAARTVKAPDFNLTDIQGRRVALSELKGKVVFLDFWATWCPPCVIALPAVEKMVEEYKGKNLVVLSVNLDGSEAPLKRFLATHKMTSRVVFAGESGVDMKYQVEGIPAYFIIDQNGNVTKAWQGYSPNMPSHWEEEIERLLKL